MKYLNTSYINFCQHTQQLNHARTHLCTRPFFAIMFPIEHEVKLTINILSPLKSYHKQFLYTSSFSLQFELPSGSKTTPCYLTILASLECSCSNYSPFNSNPVDVFNFQTNALKLAQRSFKLARSGFDLAQTWSECQA